MYLEGDRTVLAILAMGAISFFITIFIGFVYFVFPKRCNKCGKLLAFDSLVSDKVKYYEAGQWTIIERSFSQKTCLSCGYKGKLTPLNRSHRLEK
ncbi:MAG: hypothetical protein M1155_02735 [Patescibacteria group bacterium]|nr:hypothetical protein [Patescibacteria group bacterium]